MVGRSDKMDWEMRPTTVDHKAVECGLRDDLAKLGRPLDDGKIKILMHSISSYRASENALARPAKSQRARYVKRLQTRITKFAAQAEKLKEALGGDEMFDELRVPPDSALYQRMHELVSEAVLLSQVTLASKAPGNGDAGGRTKKGQRSRFLAADALYLFYAIYPPKRSFVASKSGPQISGEALNYLIAVFRAAGRKLSLDEAREIVRDLPADVSKLAVKSIKLVRAPS